MSYRLHASMMHDGLPPPEVRLYNPKNNGLLETPVDERGLVDLDKLITLTKSTVDPDYSWVSRLNDVHHLQWYGNLYPGGVSDSDVDKRKFRELVNRKAFIPRLFHNWIHYIMLPPSVPSNDVMKYSIDAQRVAMSLARTASHAVRLTRTPHISDRSLEESLDRAFINYNLYVENAREVPMEFRRVAIENVEARDIDELFVVNKRLGRLALDKVPILTRRILSSAA